MPTKTIAPHDTVSDLAAKIREANRVYYSGGTPMADEDYDKLKRQLRDLDDTHPLLRETGAPVNPTSGLVKALHHIPMGSLDNAMGEEDIRKFVRRVVKNLADQDAGFPTAFVTQPKMDGFSIDLYYVDGLFVRAITRGDGIEGEDVTHTVKRAKGVPPALTERVSLSTRGEVVIHKDDFAKHFGDYSNARASAAGTARRLDGMRAEFLQFYAFNAVHNDGGAPIATTEQKAIEYLDRLGFRVVESVLVGGTTEDEVIAALVEVWNVWKVRRANLPFDIDGVVAKVSNMRRSLACGVSGNCPRAMVAMKWPGSMTAQSKIVGITHSVGRTGSITPVATITPVECGGVVISSVSLANWDEVARLGAGLGADVVVERAGEVIPKITKVLKAPASVFERPTTCPSCKAATVVDGPRQVCQNPSCSAQSYRKVWHWVQKRNIMHLGPETIDALMVIDGPVQAASDLYPLTESDIAKACGGYTMAKKIRAQLDASRECPLHDLVGCVGIVGFGTTDALKLCRALGLQTLDDFLGLTREEVLACDGFADEKADNLMRGIAAWAPELRALAKHLNVTPPPLRASAGTGPLAGKKFCITGTTEMSRDALKAVLSKAGGEWHSSVVNGLDFLVMADANSTSNKAQDARRKGVTVISERDALDLAGYNA